MSSPIGFNRLTIPPSANRDLETFYGLDEWERRACKTGEKKKAKCVGDGVLCLGIKKVSCPSPGYHVLVSLGRQTGRCEGGGVAAAQV